MLSTVLPFAFIFSAVIVLTRKQVFCILPLCLAIFWLFLMRNMFILFYFPDWLTSLFFTARSNGADTIATNNPLIVNLKANV